MRIKFKSQDRHTDVRERAQKIEFIAESPKDQEKLAAMLRKTLGVPFNFRKDPRVTAGEWSDTPKVETPG